LIEQNLTPKRTPLSFATSFGAFVLDPVVFSHRRFLIGTTTISPRSSEWGDLGPLKMNSGAVWLRGESNITKQYRNS